MNSLRGDLETLFGRMRVVVGNFVSGNFYGAGGNSRIVMVGGLPWLQNMSLFQQLWLFSAFNALAWRDDDGIVSSLPEVAAQVPWCPIQQ